MKKTILTLLFVLVCLCVYSSQAYDFSVQKASYTIDVNRNACFDVSEHYYIYYYGPHHGFVRSIPVEYSNTDRCLNAAVSNIKCTSEIADVYRENGYLNIQIGSADTYVDGSKEYVVSYRYDNGDYNYDDYDEFYFNIVGDSWDCPFDDVSAVVRIPYSSEEEKQSMLKYWAFTDGYWGSEGFDGTSSYKEESDCIYFYANVKHLEPGQALTLRVQMPQGYWNDDARRIKDNRSVYIFVCTVFSFVVLCLVFYIWKRFGKDRIPVISATYRAPDGLSPSLCGYVYGNVALNRMLASMLFYWAQQGYVTISGTSKGENLTIKKVKDIDSGVPDSELDLFKSFFRTSDTVTFDSLEKQNFYNDAERVKGKLPLYFKGEKALFEAKSSVLCALCVFLGLVCRTFTVFSVFNIDWLVDFIPFAFIVSLFITGFEYLCFYTLMKKWYTRNNNILASIFSCIVSAIYSCLCAFVFYSCGFNPVVGALCAIFSSIILFLSSIINKRTKYGARIYEQVLGFREFILKTETDRLKVMSDEDPSLFYNVLCYAIIFGLEEKWSAKFKSISVPAPEWYGCPGYTDYLISRAICRSVIRSLSRVSAPPVGSSSSGPIRTGGSFFGSSGFSGGGHGGGGGHAW